MGFWNSICSWFGIDDNQSNDCATGCEINPATGLPMVGGCGGIDVAGNPYGTDLHHDAGQTGSTETDWGSSSSFDTSSLDSGSTWDH